MTPIRKCSNCYFYASLDGNRGHCYLNEPELVNAEDSCMFYQPDKDGKVLDESEPDLKAQ